MKTKKIIPQLALLLFTQSSFASIDLLRGALVLDEPDLIQLADGHHFELEKSYSSRSLHRGLWGFGWCSILEWTLKTEDHHSLVLRKCDHEEISVSFGGSGSSAQQTAWAEHIAGRYKVTLSQYKLWFSESGQLISIQSLGRSPLFLEYQGATLNALISEKERIKISWEGPFVAAIGTQAQSLRYSYEGQRLIAVESGNRRSQYGYSENDNMTFYSSPIHGIGEMAYSEEKDQIQEWKRSSGCEFRISYEDSELELKFNYHDSCPDRSTSQSLSLRRPPEDSIRIQ